MHVHNELREVRRGVMSDTGHRRRGNVIVAVAVAGQCNGCRAARAARSRVVEAVAHVCNGDDFGRPVCHVTKREVMEGRVAEACSPLNTADLAGDYIAYRISGTP